MSKEYINEINFLEQNLKAILKIDINNLSFESEAALIRMFEVVGGIAKQLQRFNVNIVKNDLIWKSTVKTRDKLSHSYYSLSINPLKKAIEDIPYLISTIDQIKKELKNK